MRRHKGSLEGAREDGVKRQLGQRRCQRIRLVETRPVEFIIAPSEVLIAAVGVNLTVTHENESYARRFHRRPAFGPGAAGS